jgi:GPH family glycoside/pentoside/hexuronide:cation symporter
MASDGRLSVGVKLGYGVADLGGNLFFTIVAFWLMFFLTDVAGLPATLAGAALMIGKIVDAITDPLVGFLSDRTRTRWGRRRPWFFTAAIPLGAAVAFLFTNPHIADKNMLFIWAAVTYSVVCTIYTCVNIPYNSLTPELTKDFNERTSLNGYRNMFSVVGTLIGAGAAMMIVKMFTPEGSVDQSNGFTMMGVIFGSLMTITALIAFFAVKEPPLPKEVKTENILKSYFHVLKNKPFRLILIPFMMNIIGVTIVTGTLKYYFDYVKKDASMDIAMLILLVTAMASMPLMVLLSKRIGKKNTYITGMSLLAATVIMIFLFGRTFEPVGMYILMFFAGVGLSTNYVMPWSIIPDTVEDDYAEHGIRREGIFYGIWTFGIKLGQAFAAFLIGIVLDLFKYVPNAAQSESGILGIMLLVGPITAVFFVISNIVLAFYPIDKKRYEETQAKIRAREG